MKQRLHTMLGQFIGAHYFRSKRAYVNSAGIVSCAQSGKVSGKQMRV